jgi:hypothetical protein
MAAKVRGSTQTKPGFDELAALAAHEYDIGLDELLKDADTERRAKRLWRLTGVILKQNFSSPVLRRPTPLIKARYRWDISADELAKRERAGAWNVKIIEQLVERRPGESTAAFVLRLKRETSFGRALRKTLQRYICSDPEILRQIADVLKKAGLDKFVGTLTPKGLLAIGANAIAPKIILLLPILSFAPAPLVAAVLRPWDNWIERFLRRICAAEPKQQAIRQDRGEGKEDGAIA